MRSRARRAAVFATFATAAFPASAAPPLAVDAPLPWRATTSSPARAAPRADTAPLLSACGDHDATLAQVASRVALGQARGEGLAAPEELAFLMRASGQPHVWPRAFSVEGALEEADLLDRLARWSKAAPPSGRKRCGIAQWRKTDGTRLVAAIAVDAIADLDPLPTLVRAGQWVTATGTMLVPTQEAKVVLLGPRGAPRAAVATVDANGRFRSSFSLDKPGRWLVQVLATTATGPRPALEAYVFASEPPPARFTAQPAPGEDAEKGPGDATAAMRRMMDAARATEGLPGLAPDAVLDKLAREHVERMIAAKTLGHDVGGGDPAARMRGAGFRSQVAGENVAVAATLPRAHRALWSSPSHRGNMLDGRFRRAGTAVAKSDDGRSWVAVLFAD